MQGWVDPGLLQASRIGSTWWVWLLIIALLVVLVIWFFSLRRMEDGAAEDDLTVIEGIGPKISSLLKGAGIKTYRALADVSEEQLQDVLKNADFRALADPTTWPEQAKLAASGDWAGLKALQDQLQGGRREG
jgi:hypothetical protein